MAEITAKERMIFHQILLDGQAIRIAETLGKLINKLFPELRLTASQEDKVTRSIIPKLNKRIDTSFEDMEALLIKELEPLLEYESEFQADILKEGGFPAKEIAAAAILALMLKKEVRGETLENSVKSIKVNLKNEVKRSLRVAIAEGASTEDINLIMKNAVSKASGRTKNLTKTIVNSATNDVAEELYKKNGIKFVRYTAVLDGATTDICRELNNQIFPIGSGPRPPQHYNCRSFIVPVADVDMFENVSYSSFLTTMNDTRLKKSDKGKFVQNEEFVTSLSKMKKEDNKLKS